MPFPVVGDPVEPFVDGVRAILTADATLSALVSGVHDHVPESSRQPEPYIVLGRRTRQNTTGALQVAGNVVTLQVDAWSKAKGPHTVHTILSRVAVLLERQPVAVAGYELVAGSVTCEYGEVFDEPDEDQPGARLYHGVQRWVAEIHG